MTKPSSERVLFSLRSSSRKHINLRRLNLLFLKFPGHRQNVTRSLVSISQTCMLTQFLIRSLLLLETLWSKPLLSILVLQELFRMDHWALLAVFKFSTFRGFSSSKFQNFPHFFLRTVPKTQEPQGLLVQSKFYSNQYYILVTILTFLTKGR